MCVLQHRRQAEVAYLRDRQTLLEDVLVRALDEVSTAKPKHPLHFIAEYVGRQALLHETEATELNNMKLQIKVNTLEERVAALKTQLKSQAGTAAQATTTRVLRSKTSGPRRQSLLQGSSRSLQEAALHDDIVRGVIETADSELGTYLMKQVPLPSSTEHNKLFPKTYHCNLIELNPIRSYPHLNRPSLLTPPPTSPDPAYPSSLLHKSHPRPISTVPGLFGLQPE